jgi:hypothetical protein
LWARRRGGAKNTLNAADAEQVEKAFRERLATIANEPTNESATEASLRGHRGGHRKKATPSSHREQRFGFTDTPADP